MLPEEALIVLLAFGAFGLLLLGLWNFLSPTQPRHPVPRRSQPAPRAGRPHRQSALQRRGQSQAAPYTRRQLPLAPSPVPLAPLPAVLRQASEPAEVVAEAPVEAVAQVPVEPVAAELVAAEPVALGSEAPLEPAQLEVTPPDLQPAPVELAVVPVEPAPVELEATPVELEAAPVELEPAPVELEPAPVELEAAPVALEATPVALGITPAEPAAVDIEPAPAIALPGEGDSVVETCFALYQEQRYSDVIDRASAALTAGSDGRPPDERQEQAALWSIVALARQARGEDTPARTALENAIAAAPDGDRPIYERQLASLAETVAQGLMAEAQRHGNPDTDDSLGLLRSAVAWLERGATAVPSDRRLDDLLVSARAVLWPAWERTVVALAQRQDFRGARRLLREALAEPSFPAVRAETFKELFSGTFSGEIGQLTAQAIRSMQEARESDALTSLQRAETLLGTLNAEALPPGRRAEVDQRLWWGYNKLGARRVESGDPEGALEPLFHALGYDVGPARRQETIALLVRALDGVADARALAIRELADHGDREAAFVQCDKLWALLRSATEMGLTQGDLISVFGKAQRLFENLGHRRA